VTCILQDYRACRHLAIYVTVSTGRSPQRSDTRNLKRRICPWSKSNLTHPLKCLYNLSQAVRYHLHQTDQKIYQCKHFNVYIAAHHLLIYPDRSASAGTVTTYPPSSEEFVPELRAPKLASGSELLRGGYQPLRTSCKCQTPNDP
jgi:hypothetical protein